MDVAGRKTRWVLLGVCLVAAALRAGAFVVLDRFHHPEVWENDTIARNLLEGKGFTYSFLGTVYRSYMEPLYPVLCALVYRVTGYSSQALALVHVLLGTLAVWLVFQCGRALASERVGLLAAGFTALHPGLIVYTTKFHPFILDSLLFVAVLAACLAFHGQRAGWSSLRLGLVTGVCVLTRPTIVASLPLVAWWLWRQVSRSTRRWLRVGGIWVVTVVAVVGPWVWRNYQIHHRLILTRSGTPMVLWIGNNPSVFTGSALTADGRPLLIDVLPPAAQREVLMQDELGQQDWFLRQARDCIVADPVSAIRRWVVKWWYFWWCSPQAGLLYPPTAFRLYQGWYLMLFGLAVRGVWRLWRTAHVGGDRPHLGWWLVFGICLATALVQSLFYVEGRHRLLLEPFLALLASQGWSFRREPGWQIGGAHAR